MGFNYHSSVRDRDIVFDETKLLKAMDTSKPKKTTICQQEQRSLVIDPKTATTEMDNSPTTKLLAKRWIANFRP